MDTKDTDIKQEPTAPGAEGNDGGFPQNNPAECGICFTLFDDIERRPRTLPCGHTFCTSCLIVLLETKNLTCPSCRVKHRTRKINKIPINYNLEEILRQQRQMLRHNKALASLIPSKNVNTTEGLLPSNEDTTSSKESGTPADENTDWKKKYQELFPDVKTVTTSKKIRDVTKKALMMVDDEAGATEQTNQLIDFTRPLMDKVLILLKYINFEDLKQMKPYIKKKVEAGEVFGIQENQNDYTYSRLSLDNGRLLLHCLQNQPPPHGAITLPVSEIIKTLIPKSTITFLEMAWEGVTRGRVYIRAGSVSFKSDSEKSGEFRINTFCGHQSSGASIGHVESGLEVVKAAVQLNDIKQVTVVDCGVVVPL
ncbi:hypothetical protein Pmani_019506 [Petrolisthes manimaculis]|uniref:RING-type domain-containing protein n=1 Tax=Petrolisthes manimaculis TaxID=1843537 RepID=A0AAE1PI23_9EUCA|nr:hypothetical protein Pmani_019506 [Petrolisthes manimaculis]